MTITRILLAASLATMLGSAAFAQTAAGTQTPPASDPPAANAAPMMNKKAIAKACSDEADTKNLHGKARKSFRSQCKAMKMKGK